MNEEEIARAARDYEREEWQRLIDQYGAERLAHSCTRQVLRQLVDALAAIAGPRSVSFLIAPNDEDRAAFPAEGRVADALTEAEQWLSRELERQPGKSKGEHASN